MKLIYSYSDYKNYTTDWVSDTERSAANVSLRSLSQRLGLVSSNYLSLILAGKRKLKDDLALKLAGVFGFNFDETQFFLALVSLNQAETEIERKFFRRQLLLLRRRKPTHARQRTNVLATDWMLPIVLMLIADRTQMEAEKAVCAQLSVNPPEARKLIELAIELNLVKKDARYKLSASFLTDRDPKSKRKAHLDFLKKHVELLSRHMDVSYNQGSKHVVHVLGMGTERYKEVFSKIDKISEEVASLVAEDPADDVYVMHLHCSPLKSYLGN